MRNKLIVPGILLYFLIHASTVDAQGSLNLKRYAKVSLEYNMNRPGGDYRGFEMKLDATCKQCAEECRRDTKCIAFTYVEPERRGMKPQCWLKSSLRNLAYDERCVSGIKYFPYANPPNKVRQRATTAVKWEMPDSNTDEVALYFTQSKNRDFPGGDYKSFELKAGEDCQACINACRHDPNCIAYTYVKPGLQQTNAVCWLKSEINDSVENDNCFSGLKQVMKKNFSWIPIFLPAYTVSKVENQNIPGNNYKSFELPQGTDCNTCIDSCLNDPKCKSYTYIKPGVQKKNAVCWLKSSAAYPESDSTCISGVRLAKR
jgi:hypothetical protein